MKKSTYDSKVKNLSKEESEALQNALNVAVEVTGLKNKNAVINHNGLVSSNSAYSLTRDVPYAIKSNEAQSDVYNGNKFYYYEFEDGKRVTAKTLFSGVDFKDCIYVNDKKGYLSDSDKDKVEKANTLELAEVAIAIAKKSLTVIYLGKTESKSHDWDNKIYVTKG